MTRAFTRRRRRALVAVVSSSSTTAALVDPSRICERGRSVMQSLSTSIAIIIASELVSTTSGGGQAATRAALSTCRD
jgi:hypothetical protein